MYATKKPSLRTHYSVFPSDQIKVQQRYLSSLASISLSSCTSCTPIPYRLKKDQSYCTWIRRFTWVARAQHGKVGGCRWGTVNRSIGEWTRNGCRVAWLCCTAHTGSKRRLSISSRIHVIKIPCVAYSRNLALTKQERSVGLIRADACKPCKPRGRKEAEYT